jgi:lipopolysaccharide transport system ATP-binding protein
MPNSPAIRVERLSKRYIIGHQNQANTFRDLLSAGINGLWKSLKRRRIEREDFWALRDLNFEIKKGEIIGVIGNNGAGKSTLLKLLSRITEPTEGRIQLNGRVASLLEVGTGFHPELSGRENIFLNGAILGMSRVEIKEKFDKIVAFAEVERFLDTPVKRYSSGMYVRLAFSVSAHLEPEILIVDEVLAVGDAAFQKKCIAKMQDVASKEGRTILLVSHNMPTIRDLTSRCMLLSAGRLISEGPTLEVLDNYAKQSEHTISSTGKVSEILKIEVIDESGLSLPPILSGRSLRLRVRIRLKKETLVTLDLRLHDLQGTALGFSHFGHYNQWYIEPIPGEYECEFTLGLPPMASGHYGLDVITHVEGTGPDHFLRNALILESDSRINYQNPWDLRKEYHLGLFVMDHQIPSVRRIL